MRNKEAFRSNFFRFFGSVGSIPLRRYSFIGVIHDFGSSAVPMTQSTSISSVLGWRGPLRALIPTIEHLMCWHTWRVSPPSCSLLWDMSYGVIVEIVQEFPSFWQISRSILSLGLKLSSDLTHHQLRVTENKVFQLNSFAIFNPAMLNILLRYLLMEIPILMHITWTKMYFLFCDK